MAYVLRQAAMRIEKTTMRGYAEIMFRSAVDGGLCPPTPHVAIDLMYVPHLIELYLPSEGLIASGGPGVQPLVACPE